MQNVGTLRILGECLTRCHLEMWSLGLSYLKDVPCMGMVGKLKHFEWMCEGVQPDDIIFVCLCQLVAMQVWLMKACACMLQ
jgi:hypothetical protein